MTNGYVMLEFHPLADLDGADVSTADPSPSASATAATGSTASSLLGTMTTTADYSARAAGALACVADTAPDSALAVHTELLAAQPDLTEAGLDDADALIALIEEVSERVSARAAAQAEATAEPTAEPTDPAAGSEDTTGGAADQATEAPTAAGD